MAQFKFTVLLMANGPLRITSGPLDLETIESTHSLQDQELKVKSVHFYCLLSNKSSKQFNHILLLSQNSRVNSGLSLNAALIKLLGPKTLLKMVAHNNAHRQ